MAEPLAIDLFCGLGGWTEGLLAEGYRVVGYDIEAHEYDGEKYPADLVLADCLELDGAQFADADLIVASPPCTEYSYMAMPWTRAKQIGRALRGEDDFPEGYIGSRTLAELNALFDASFRIQREACEEAGRHIPLVVENVRGAIPWVGRSRWNYGSYHLWGDVPALMPAVVKAHKVPGFRFAGDGGSFQTASVNEGRKGPPSKNGWVHPGDPRHTPGLDFTRIAGDHQKTMGHINLRNGASHTRHLTNPAEHEAGTKQPGLSGVRDNGKGDRWFQDGAAKSGSKSSARKAASARIAKIPLTLSRWIAATFKPERVPNA
ncbi:MAG: DNA cytosine methyltransferase [Pseudomonadota bacterium]